MYPKGCGPKAPVAMARRPGSLVAPHTHTHTPRGARSNLALKGSASCARSKDLNIGSALRTRAYTHTHTIPQRHLVKEGGGAARSPYNTTKAVARREGEPHVAGVAGVKLTAGLAMQPQAAVAERPTLKVLQHRVRQLRRINALPREQRIQLSTKTARWRWRIALRFDVGHLCCRATGTSLGFSCVLIPWRKSVSATLHGSTGHKQGLSRTMRSISIAKDGARQQFWLGNLVAKVLQPGRKTLYR